MKIILDDFYYKGNHFDQFVCNLPQVDIPDETFNERIIDYIKESLDQHLTKK